MIVLNILNIKPELYLIDENGNIYSNTIHNYMKPLSDKDGYLHVNLRTIDNKTSRFSIAKLVIYSFIGPPPQVLKDPTINHIDNNKLNNHYSNLEWIERSYNTSIRKNTSKGQLNRGAKLEEKQVIQICELLINTEMSAKDIAKKFNVSESAISKIKTKSKWTYLTQAYDFSCRTTIRDENGKIQIWNKNLHGGGK